MNNFAESIAKDNCYSYRKDLRTQEMKHIPETTPESTTPSTTTTPITTTIPSTTIVTYDKGDKFHREGSCTYFKDAAKNKSANMYTPCAKCARVKKGS